MLALNSLLPQARGKPHEVEREMRALLGHMRENEEEVQFNAMHCKVLLVGASCALKNLSPELKNSVETELGKLMASSRQ